MATRNTRTYTDINLLFSANPHTKDVTKKIDEEAIKASVRNLIMTKNYERPFHPEIGCQLHGLLFEHFDNITRQVMKRTIFDVIEKFEPRVTVTQVNINEREDNNELMVELSFRINNTGTPVTLNTAITRLR